MPAKKIEPSKIDDLFRSRLDNIINMRHELVVLSLLINWQRLEEHFAEFYSDDGRPANAIRLMVGLHLLKNIKGLSDETVCEEWRENPYMQYFCGEEYFCHDFPIDTTVQEKSITHPTEHGLLLGAIENLGDAAKKEGISLRQSYIRVARLASIKAGRYIHAKQMKRAKGQIKFLRVRLKRIIRDVRRKINTVSGALESALSKAMRIGSQKRGDKNYLYAWHAPEVECIGKGKARKPYEFGCKASLATNINPAKGGHFILHAQALHGNPFDSHTLKNALDDIEKVVGAKPLRAFVDKGYKGHKLDKTNCPTDIFITGAKRNITPQIKREMKRRAVIEPIIGHAKNDGLLGKNHLKGRHGDKINTTLAATGFNLRQLLRYIRILWLYLVMQLLQNPARQNLKMAS